MKTLFVNPLTVSKKAGDQELRQNVFEHPDPLAESYGDLPGSGEKGVCSTVKPLPPRIQEVAGQVTLTSMDFGLAFSVFVKCTLRTPSLKSAVILLESVSSGSVKLRMKLP